MVIVGGLSLATQYILSISKELKLKDAAILGNENSASHSGK